MSSKSVLIVEDEKILQDVYKLILSSKGYIVHTPNNGLEGLKSLKEHEPDVMLLDIFMPQMDGKEVLRNINKNDYPDTKIIVYSNLSDSETEQEVLLNGADRFILKSSMTPHDLTQLIKDVTA